MISTTAANRVLAPTAAQRRTHYILGIDSLRAIAVLSVLAYHLRSTWLPGGYLGVDVFFVISGYVVSSAVAAGMPDESIWRSSLRFYSRRVVRLFPSLLLCLTVSFASVVLFVPSSWLSTTTWSTGLLAFAGLSNFGLVWLAEPYFSPRAEFNPFTHTWSLAVEEQFYLVFPWLVLGWFVLGRSPKTVRSGVAFMGALTVGSAAYCAWASTTRPDLAFYLLPSRFWELAAGMWLAYLHARHRGLNSGWARRAVPMSLVGAALIGISMVMKPVDGFPWPGALPAIVGTLLCLQGLAAAHASRLEMKWAELASVMYVGRVSYVLYLWHWPTFVLARWTTGLESTGACVAALLVTLSLAALTHHLVEQPLRRRFAAAPWPRVLTRGWASAAMFAGVCLALIAGRPWLSQTQAMQHADDWYPVLTPADRTSAPQMPGAGADDLAGRTLHVIGDSHAMAYAPMLERVKVVTGLRTQVQARAGCAVAKPLTQMPAECAPFLADAVGRVLKTARAGDLLFLPGLRHARIADQWAAEPVSQVIAREQMETVATARNAAAKQALGWLRQAQDLGLTVLLEAPKPVYAAPAFRCVDWFNRMNPICAQGLTISRGELAPLLAPTRRMLGTLEGPNVFVWDPFDVLCPRTHCSALDDDSRPLYFDADHLSRHANLLLADHFVKTLRELPPH